MSVYRYIQWHDTDGGAVYRHFEWWPGIQNGFPTGTLFQKERASRDDIWGPAIPHGVRTPSEARKIAERQGCMHEVNIA